MNVACLGYKKLDDYLRDLDEKYKDPTKINAFLEIFNDKYNDTVNMDRPGLKYSRERLGNEDKILLAPGHSFTPEKVVRMENGFIVIGTLTYEEG